MSQAHSGPSGDPRIGSLLAERYRIHALLGEGGMGKVYAGEHVLMRKRVAIKVLHGELVVLTDIVKRFEREAMASANIDHPNVAVATDFGRLNDGSIFLVLEYVQGVSLRSEIADGAFGLVRALHVTRQIASALTAAHLRGIVHRDLKPENVMLVERAGDPDFVKVLDFGIAKVPIQDKSERGSLRPGQVITKVGMVFGTPEYMAPEQALGQDVDSRADQYALGVMLFEMLTGNRPFKSQNAVALLGQQLQGPIPRICERCPGQLIPSALEDLVAKLLAPDRDHRFDSCQEVVNVVEMLLLELQPAVLMRGSRPDASALPLEVPASSRGWANHSFGFGSRSAPMLQLESSESAVAASGAKAIARGAKSKKRKFSTQLLLALLSGLVAGSVVVGLWLASSRKPIARRSAPVSGGSVPSRNPLQPEPPLRASPGEIAAAQAQGLAALERLAGRFPLDTTVLVELGKARLGSGDCGVALDPIAQALTIDAKVSGSAEVATLLWKTVQKRECMERTFALLTGPMGAKGLDILSDLAETKGVKSVVRTRAKSLFDDARK